MRIWLSILLGAALTLLAADYLHPDYDAGADLPADRVYPLGRIFPFTAFSGHDVAEMRAQHCSLGMWVYGSRSIQHYVKAAKEARFPVAYPVTAHQDGKPASIHTLSGKGAKVDWKAVCADLEAQVKTALAEYSDCIAWWYFQPEELRHWKSNEMRLLREVKRIIQELDPLKRPVWMYNPNHYGAESLKHYTPILDILGKGMYVNYSGHRDQRVWARYSCENQARAIAETNSKAFPICVPEMFQEPPEGRLDDIPAWVRHDVYTGLLCGCKGVAIFAFSKRPKFSADARDTYLEAYDRAARELAGPLGQVFLFGRPASTLKHVQTDGPREVELKLSKNTLKFPPVKALEMEHRTGRYYFLVNSATEAVALRVEGLPKGLKVRLRDAATNRVVRDNVEGSWEAVLPPLGVLLYRLEAP